MIHQRPQWKLNPKVFSLFVIFEHPDDFPRNYVIRRQATPGGMIVITDEIGICDTLEEARSLLPLQADSCIGRQPGDVPSLLEVWI